MASIAADSSNAWRGLALGALDDGGGVLTSKLLGATARLIGGDFSFVQISDSHIGFNKDANKDVCRDVAKSDGEDQRFASCRQTS